MAHTIANGYSLFKKRTVLCESLRVTTEKTGLDWFSRGPLVVPGSIPPMIVDRIQYSTGTQQLVGLTSMYQYWYQYQYQSQ